MAADDARRLRFGNRARLALCRFTGNSGAPHCHNSLGTRHLSLHMKYSAGALSHEKIMRCIELYGREVIPRLARSIAPALASIHLASDPGMTHFHAVGIYCHNVSAHSKRKLADPVAQAK